MSKLKPRERDAIVQALRAGVVPKLGLRHLQVGRAREIEELVKDVDRIADGGSAIRFVIGDYGSGKTFFMNLIRLVALEKGLVVMFADLAPDRRLHATAGQTRGYMPKWRETFRPAPSPMVEPLPASSSVSSARLSRTPRRVIS
jgi:ABC-type Mn2+/Zn2+ transport system ATPase subunit